MRPTMQWGLQNGVDSAQSCNRPHEMTTVVYLTGPLALGIAVSLHRDLHGKVYDG